MINKSLFSSASTEWETPKELFDRWNRIFRFTLDVCATKENAKCDHFYTKEDDALQQTWHGAKCFMNPPYGNAEHPCKKNCKKMKCIERGHHISEYIPGIYDFVKKAKEESDRGALVVALLPSRTDTEWFKVWVEPYTIVRFLPGRVKFVGAPSFAPFPSMIAIWGL